MKIDSIVASPVAFFFFVDRVNFVLLSKLHVTMKDIEHLIKNNLIYYIPRARRASILPYLLQV